MTIERDLTQEREESKKTMKIKRHFEVQQSINKLFIWFAVWYITADHAPLCAGDTREEGNHWGHDAVYRLPQVQGVCCKTQPAVWRHYYAGTS